MLLLLSSLLLIFSFPPFITGFFSFFALVPFFLVLRGKNYKKAFSNGYLMGLFLCAGTLYWVLWSTIAGGIALLVYLPLFWALFAFLFSFFYRRWGEASIWLIPFLWTALEWINSFGDLAFPWLTLGYTQTYSLALIQFASISGVYSVSFWIVLINILAYQIIIKRNEAKKTLMFSAAILFLLLFPYLYGIYEIPDNKIDDDIKVALLQGNIDPYKKWKKEYITKSFDIYYDLALKANRENPELIIWPETAAPCYVRYQHKYKNLLHNMTDSLGVPMLVGAPHYRYNKNKKINYYNSAFFFEPRKRYLKQYDKMRLVPFGEQIPFDDYFPLLKKINLGEGDFTEGKKYTKFDFSETSFSVLICFESIFPQLVRNFVKGGSKFLVNVTNDGWFGKTSGPFQHAQIAVFRAIENRISIARCANTGISMLIDPYGRVYKKTKLFVEKALVGSIPKKNATETFYTKYGDIFAVICASICICSFIVSIIFK